MKTMLIKKVERYAWDYLFLVPVLVGYILRMYYNVLIQIFYESMSISLMLGAYWLEGLHRENEEIDYLPFKRGRAISFVQQLHHPLKLLRLLCYIYSALPKPGYYKVIPTVSCCILVFQLLVGLWIAASARFCGRYPRWLFGLDRQIYCMSGSLKLYRIRRWYTLGLVVCIRAVCEYFQWGQFSTKAAEVTWWGLFISLLPTQIQEEERFITSCMFILNGDSKPLLLPFVVLTIAFFAQFIELFITRRS